jgi:predicted Zn-dependent peptidase
MIQTTQLKNGMRVATHTMPSAHSVAVSVGVDVGARHEDEPRNGISHMLEHMAFKGTQKRNALEIAEAFDAVGGSLNAYTSMEHTVYYGRVLQENLDVAVDVLSDIVQHSTFDDEELARERQVILQEIAMHHDTPDDLIFDRFTECAYPDQAIGRSILGTKEKVSGFTRADLQAYTDEHYGAKRMVVAAAGNVQHDAFVAMIEEAFADLPELTPQTGKAGRYQGGQDVLTKDLEQLHLLLGFPAANYHDDEYRTQQVLSTLLGGGMSSRLFQEVREKRGLAYSIYSFLNAYHDCGLFGIYAGTGAAEAAQVLGLVAEQMQALTAHVTEEELNRAKTQLKASLLMGQESAASQSDFLCRHLLIFGRVKPMEEIVESIDAVDVAAIQASVRQLLKGGLTVSAIGPTASMPDLPSIEENFCV